VTNARFASLHGLPVGPVPLSTTPVPLLKPHARHELVCCRAADAAGFRLALVVVAPASGLLSFRFALFAFRFTPSSPDRSVFCFSHRAKQRVTSAIEV